MYCIFNLKFPNFESMKLRKKIAIGLCSFYLLSVIGIAA